MEYNELLDRAFKQLPELSKENVDFKVPTVDSIIEGNKTIFRNLGPIADVARRDKDDIIKFLTKELSAPISIDDQRAVISAKIQQGALDSKIKKYFETYIICKECRKPDTRIEGMDRGYMVIVCEACGARYSIKGYR
jgi:translation initiation factor 2 subunit 2